MRYFCEGAGVRHASRPKGAADVKNQLPHLSQPASSVARARTAINRDAVRKGSLRSEDATLPHFSQLEQTRLETQARTGYYLPKRA
jgi:hypothetical protein